MLGGTHRCSDRPTDERAAGRERGGSVWNSHRAAADTEGWREAGAGPTTRTVSTRVQRAALGQLGGASSELGSGTGEKVSLWMVSLHSLKKKALPGSERKCWRTEVTLHVSKTIRCGEAPLKRFTLRTRKLRPGKSVINGIELA